MRIFYPGSGSPVLRLDQLEAIAKITKEIKTGSHGVLVGAGMGSGKTVVTIEVIANLKPPRVLIVGVRDAYGQWAKAAKEQELNRSIYQIDSSSDGKKNLAILIDGDPGIYYVGLEMLRTQDWEQVSETYPTHPDIKAYFGDAIGDYTIPVKSSKQIRTYATMPKLDLLVSDESHRHSNAKTDSIKTLQTIKSDARIALSGTFFGNKFENAYVLATWIWDKNITGTKSTFEAMYCVKEAVMSKDGRRQLKSPRGFPLSKIVGERVAGEYVETLPCYVFIETPLGAVPDSELVVVKLHEEQKRQYNEMESQFLTWIPSANGMAPLVAGLPITQRQRLRTAALGAMTLVQGKPKADGSPTDTITFEPDCKSTTLDAAYHILHKPDWVGEKVLILTHSLPFAKEAARRIGKKYSVALKTGGVTSKKWEADKEAFMLPVSETGSIQYLVAVISAVGTAMDGLQANCSKVLWLSEDENNTNNIQGSNRIWRDGVNVSQYRSVKIIQAGTIAEEIITRNNAHKTKTMKSISGNN